MLFVYIIYSQKLDKYYVGHTKNVTVRMGQHQQGLSKFTSKSQDWQLKFFKEFPTRKEASDFETMVKRKKSRKYIEWLIGSL